MKLNKELFEMNLEDMDHYGYMTGTTAHRPEESERFQKRVGICKKRLMDHFEETEKEIEQLKRELQELKLQKQ